MFSYTMQRLLYPINRKFSLGTISNNRFSNNRFLGAVCWKIWLFVYIPQQQTAAKSNLLFNRRNKKVLGGKHHVLVYYADASTPDPEGVVCCNTFE